MFWSEVRCQGGNDPLSVNIDKARTRAGTLILKRLHETTCIFVALLAIFAEAPARAQPAPTPEEVQQAQVRWNEGKAYFDAGNFEAARVAFKQAYTVFPHAAFLQNLGEAELRTGRHVEAARHFTAFLRASSTGSPAQRELAKKSLAKAAERLGSIIVTTNVDDAEIRIDDEVVGRSPLGSLAWYVEPGRHLITARKDGYLDGSERIDVAIGPPRTVLVRVQRVVGGRSEPPPEEPKLANAVPPPTSATIANEPHAAPIVAWPEPTRAGVPARTLVLLSGAALTIGAAAVGTVYTLRTSADWRRVRDAQAQVAQVDPTYPIGVCEKPTNADVIDLCRRYNDEVLQHHSDRRIRDVALVGAGVLGVATLATFFIWRPRSTAAVSVTPALNPAAPGFVVFGNF
jgi:Tetratricopeptide repeat/PEGA domain